MELVVKRFDQLTVEELYEIIKLRVEVFMIEQKCFYKDLDYLDYGCYHSFIEENGKILCYLRILDRGMSFDEISFGRVVSNKLYRGRGLCKKLLQNSIKFVEETLNEKIIKLRAQVYVLNLYRSLGFVEFGDQYLDIGIPHINMIYESSTN